MKVFWSWQSDTPAKNNHYFVRDALEIAFEKVATELDLDEASRPEIDHDTKDEPGLVSIVDSIFDKIERAKVFVGDITYVGTTTKGKLLPNPNVMIELGHALTSLGRERIILVANNVYGGKPEDLPFDLRHRRAPITYTLAEGATTAERNKARDALAKALAGALSLSLGKVIEDAAKQANFPAIAAREGDRSTWLASGEKIQHHDYFHNAGIETWEVLEEPRFYMRVIPANFICSMTPREVHDIGTNGGLQKLDPWRNGDGGVNSMGVVQVGFLPDRTATSVTQWFKETGEVWAFNCHASFQQNTSSPRLLAYGVIPKSWRRHLDATLRFMKSLGVTGPLHVEAGVTGIKQVKWGSDFGRHYTCLAEEIHLERAEAKWDDNTQNQFLTDTFNLLCDAYNQPRLTVEQFLALL